MVALNNENVPEVKKPTFWQNVKYRVFGTPYSLEQARERVGVGAAVREFYPIDMPSTSLEAVRKYNPEGADRIATGEAIGRETDPAKKQEIMSAWENRYRAQHPEEAATASPVLSR